MSFPVAWLDEQKTVIQIDIQAPPTWPAFVKAAEEAAALARSVTYPVVLIVHPHKLPMPKGERPLPYLQKALSALPRNISHILFIMDRSAGLFEKTMTSIFARIALGRNVQMVGTEAEAQQIIAAIRQRSSEKEAVSRS